MHKDNIPLSELYAMQQICKDKIEEAKYWLPAETDDIIFDEEVYKNNLKKAQKPLQLINSQIEIKYEEILKSLK
jgi:hypothetical protein